MNEDKILHNEEIDIADKNSTPSFYSSLANDPYYNSIRANTDSGNNLYKFLKVVDFSVTVPITYTDPDTGMTLGGVVTTSVNYEVARSDSSALLVEIYPKSDNAYPTGFLGIRFKDFGTYGMFTADGTILGVPSAFNANFKLFLYEIIN